MTTEKLPQCKCKTIVALFCVCVAFATLLTSRTGEMLRSSVVKRLQPPDKEGNVTKCILYDRVPRTGSTTLGLTLEQCLLSKGYRVLSADTRSVSKYSVIKRLAGIVYDMSGGVARKLAAARHHVCARREDFDKLVKACDRLLYISSCAPMASRLESMAKYWVASGHGNATVTSKRVLKRMEAYASESWAVREAYFEAYPYTNGTHPRGTAEDDRVVPDYVIRNSQLVADTHALLNALKCDMRIESDNMHSVEDQAVEEVIRNYVKNMVRMGDARYKAMMRLATEGNSAGLRLASTF